MHQRLVELCAIRDRELTDEEKAEAIRLASYERRNKRHRERYANEPEYRETMKQRSRGQKPRSWSQRCL